MEFLGDIAISEIGLDFAVEYGFIVIKAVNREEIPFFTQFPRMIEILELLMAGKICRIKSNAIIVCKESILRN